MVVKAMLEKQIMECVVLSSLVRMDEVLAHVLVDPVHNLPKMVVSPIAVPFWGGGVPMIRIVIV